MSSILIDSENFFYYFNVSCDKCKEVIQANNLIVNNGSIICPKCNELL